MWVNKYKQMKVQNKIKFEQFKIKSRKGWNEVKDIILLLILLNFIINYMHNNLGTRQLIIENTSASEVQREVKQLSPVEKQETVTDNGTPVIKIGEFSAYTADENQTDSDPLTMASGKKVYEGAIANNCLDFGTKVEVNGKVYTVEDKMNSRYDCDHFDIYFTDYEEAIKFGRKQLEYKILN